MGHAVILAALAGDTTDFEGMTAKVVDPRGGNGLTTSFSTLIKFYAGAAPAGVPQLFLA